MSNDIQARFQYHQLSPQGLELTDKFRTLYGELAQELQDSMPVDSRERSLALTKLEESLMFANAAVARNSYYQA